MPLLQYKQQQQNKSTKLNRNKRAVQLAKWVCFNNEIQKQNISKLRAHLVLCEYAILIIQSFMVGVFAGITQTYLQCYLLRVLLSTFMHHKTTFFSLKFLDLCTERVSFIQCLFWYHTGYKLQIRNLFFLFFCFQLITYFFYRIVFIRLSMLAVWIW